MPTFTKGSQSMTFGGSPTVSELADGVLIHVGTGSAELTSYTPAESGSGTLLRNGAAVNPSGVPKDAAGVDATPFDGRHGYSDVFRPTLPLTMRAGDVVIIAQSAAERTTSYRSRSYHPSPGRSYVDRMMIAMAVGFPQGGTPSDHMRVCGLGNSPHARMLRANFPLFASTLRTHLLPSVIDLSALSGITELPITDYEAWFADFCGLVRDGWSSYYATPDEQFPGYGSIVSGLVSHGLLYLCSSDYTEEQKKPLARRMAQWGSDLFGAYLDGRRTYSNGGHCQGEKALVMLFGLLTGLEEAMRIDQTLAREYPGDQRFQESVVFDKFPALPGKVDRWFWSESPTWTQRYNCFAFGHPDGDYQREDPKAWTVENGNHTSQEFRLTGYLEQVAGSQLGTALAFRLFADSFSRAGLIGELGQAFYDFLVDWYAGPPQAAIDRMIAANPALAGIKWGQSYAEGMPADLARAAWAAHHPDL